MMLEQLCILLTLVSCAIHKVTCASSKDIVYSRINRGDVDIRPYEQHWNDLPPFSPTLASNEEGEIVYLQDEGQVSGTGVDSHEAYFANGLYKESWPGPSHGEKRFEQGVGAHEKKLKGLTSSTSQIDPLQELERFREYAPDATPSSFTPEYMAFEAERYAHRSREEHRLSLRAAMSNGKETVDEETGSVIPIEWKGLSNYGKVKEKYGGVVLGQIVQDYRRLMKSSGVEMEYKQALQDFKDAIDLNLVHSISAGTAEDKQLAADEVYHRAGVYQLNKDHYARCQARREE